MRQKWIKMWERWEYHLHKMDLVMQCFISPYAAKTIGSRLTGIISILSPQGGHAELMSEASHDKFFKFVGQIYSNPTRFAWHQKEYKKFKNQLIKTTKKIGQRADKEQQNQKLTAFLREFWEADTKFMLIGQWLAFYLGEQVEEDLRRFVNRNISD